MNHDEDELNLAGLERQFTENYRRNMYDMFVIRNSLNMFLEFINVEELTIQNKCKLYKKFIKIYEEYYKNIISAEDYENYEDVDKEYFEMTNEIVNNIKTIFKRIQIISFEEIIKEQMKPSRVLYLITTYKDYEFND